MNSYLYELECGIEAVSKASVICGKVCHDLVNIRQSSVLTKEDKSPVTIADYATQAIIVSLLAPKFPTYCFIGEENSDALRDVANAHLLDSVCALVREIIPTISNDEILHNIDLCSYDGKSPGVTYWVIDPIDGTKGFLRREQFAVCLGLINGNFEPVVGILGCSNLNFLDYNQGVSNDVNNAGSLLYAVKGGGAYVRKLYTPLSPSHVSFLYPNMFFNPECEKKCESDNQDNSTHSVPDVNIYVSRLVDNSKGHNETDELIATSTCRRLHEAILIESVEASSSNHEILQLITNKLHLIHDTVRMDSQAKYACVSYGSMCNIDGYVRLSSNLEYRENIWDHAAGYVILIEAGGVISDINGNKLDFSTGRQLENNCGIVACNGSYLHDAIVQSLKDR